MNYDLLLQINNPSAREGPCRRVREEGTGEDQISVGEHEIAGCHFHQDRQRWA